MHVLKKMQFNTSSINKEDRTKPFRLELKNTFGELPKVCLIILNAIPIKPLSYLLLA